MCGNKVYFANISSNYPFLTNYRFSLYSLLNLTIGEKTKEYEDKEFRNKASIIAKVSKMSKTHFWSITEA